MAAAKPVWVKPVLFLQDLVLAITFAAFILSLYKIKLSWQAGI